MKVAASAARRVLGFAALALGAWAVWAVVRTPRASEVARSFTSSEQCQSCHADVYAEWAASWHARAWSDPEVRALSNEFANTDCIDCHAPRPVFETGVGARVLPRSTRRGEGVDCIACHVLPVNHASGGLVAGSRDAPRAACRPVALRELGSSAFCAACHDQHDTTKQWAATDYAARGIGCVDCHMPPWSPAADGATPRGREHSMHGGHDLPLLQRAVEMRGRRDGGRWVIEVENVGAGHHFPTEERSRAADLFWRPLPSAGQPWRHAYRFRSPYHSEGLPDTLLAAHETRSIAIEGEGSEGAIEAVLFYTLKPFWTDPAHPDPEHEARRIHSLELLP